MAALVLCLAVVGVVAQLSLSAPTSTDTPLIKAWNLDSDEKARDPEYGALRKALVSALSLRQDDANSNATTKLTPWGAAALADPSDLTKDVGEQKFIGANHPFFRLLLTFLGFNPTNTVTGTTGLGGTSVGGNVVQNPSFFGNGLFARGRDSITKTDTEEQTKDENKVRIQANRNQQAANNGVKRLNNNRKKQQNPQRLLQVQNVKKETALYQEDNTQEGNRPKQQHLYKFVVSRESPEDRKTVGINEDNSSKE